jgi:multidrug resistance efflux pump
MIKILVLLLPLLAFSKVHYAKMEPYESVILKSAVSALVVDVDLKSEGLMVADKRVIHLDDSLDKINLKDTQKSITLVAEMLELNKEIESSLSSTMDRKKSYYTRINKNATASTTQKDNAFNAFISAKTQYLGTKEKIINFNKQTIDLNYKLKQLEDTIAKKSIVLKNKYLYKLIVRKGDFVNPGTPLAQVEDASKAKLVLFLEAEELVDIENKTVYLDGKKTEYKADKVWSMADAKFISSYRAEIYIPAPKGSFSKLIKIEIK